MDDIHKNFHTARRSKYFWEDQKFTYYVCFFFFFFIVISESQIKAKGQAPTVVNRAREWSCVFQTVELWVMSIRAQRKHPDFAVTVPETLNWCVFMAQGAVSRLSVVLCPPGRRLRVPCLSGAKANVG